MTMTGLDTFAVTKSVRDITLFEHETQHMVCKCRQLYGVGSPVRRSVCDGALGQLRRGSSYIFQSTHVAASALSRCLLHYPWCIISAYWFGHRFPPEHLTLQTAASRVCSRMCSIASVYRLSLVLLVLLMQLLHLALCTAFLAAVTTPGKTSPSIQCR